MFEPFVMIAMCDCTTNEKTGQKVCTPFLRAFANGCQGIHMVEDYDLNGNPYKPRGVVSSDAKCCDCCDNDEKIEVCYDLKCLTAKRERNGGLENISIMDGNGIPGEIVNFSPPANDTQTIADALNNISYLGFATWHASPEKPGFLCVSISSHSLIPKAASGSRFRRFKSSKTGGGPKMQVSHSGYGAYGTTQDGSSAGAPSVTNALITSSNTHYYCKLNLDRSTGFGSSTLTSIEVAKPFVSGTLQQANIFRFEFPDNSSAMYVPNYPTNNSWSDIWTSGNVGSASNRTLWTENLQHWMEFIIGQGLTYGNSKCYTLWSTVKDITNTNVNLDQYRGDIIIDVPSNVKINNMYGIQMNPIEISSSGILNIPAGSHLVYFDEIVGVGNYTSNPYVNGTGGSTSWASDCSIANPFDSDTQIQEQLTT